MTTGTAITGVGYGELGRDTGRSVAALTVQACRAAVRDAGLAAADIDGLAMFPYRSTPPNPFSGPALEQVRRSLGIPGLRWVSQSLGDNGQLAAMTAAIDAIRAGRANHVLCYRGHLRQARRYLAGGSNPAISYDEDEHTLPYGAGSGSARGALWAARYLHVTGTTQRELGGVCVNGRAYAATNPWAYWREPVTIDDYLAARWVATPLKVLDCDYPIDGATAVVISRADLAASTRRPVWIESTGMGPGFGPTWLGWPEKAVGANAAAAHELWSQTALSPADVDVAEVYDGFSVFTLMWLEGLGLRLPGRAGGWLLEGGGRPGGDLAVNTDGGQLGVGRLHGFGKVAQAANQVRGEAVNQIDDVEVAIAAAGGGPGCVAMLLTKEPTR